MEEVWVLGRGGQGMMVTSEILAWALHAEGKYIQAFPTFDTERRNAPSAAYLRFNDQELWLHCGASEPNHIIVLDCSLLDSSGNPPESLRPSGCIVVNCPAATSLQLTQAGAKAGRVDAAQIALNHKLGTRTQPQINVLILGAFARLTGKVELSSLEQSLNRFMPGQFYENRLALREAYDKVKEVVA